MKVIAISHCHAKATDSLAYEIGTTDFYKDINLDIEKRFDASDYPSNHPSEFETIHNSKVLGMFTDEAGGKQIVEFVGLRAKLYSYKMLHGSVDIYVRGDNECYKKEYSIRWLPIVLV